MFILGILRQNRRMRQGFKIREQKSYRVTCVLNIVCHYSC
uniref:Uncharacterized protein n=1 Tax=Triticum urartu TaxID=4572 RepID=A0A8R7U7V0_TRIUA